MKNGLCCFVVFAGALGAQGTARLDSDLAALANPAATVAAIANRVTDDVLSLTDKDSQPSRQTVLDFSTELCGALAGRASSTPKVQAVTSAILAVLQSSGTSSSRFHAAVDRFRDAVIAFNATVLQARTAANQLMVLGQEIRGPEDIKVLSSK